MMTRRDYICEAEDINAVLTKDVPVATLALYVERRADRHAADNPNFDRDRYWRACIGTPETNGEQS